MTRKRFRKLYYSWVIKNRDSFDDLGKTLQNTRKVGFRPEKVKPNDYSYQRMWNFLSDSITEKQ